MPGVCWRMLRAMAQGQTQPTQGWVGGCHRMSNRFNCFGQLYRETPGGDSGLTSGLLGLEICSPLQLCDNWEWLFTSTWEFIRTPLASPCWECADLALDWDTAHEKASLGQTLWKPLCCLFSIWLHHHSCHYMSQSMLFLLEMTSSFPLI